MGKMVRLGAALNQYISFNDRFMKLDRDSRTLFWPGCALMRLNPQILGAVYAALRRSNPNMGISACCCGEPSRYAFPAKYEQRREKLRDLILDSSVTHIYTACPCCKEQLEELGCVDVSLIWRKLAQNLSPGDFDAVPPVKGCYIHDPCLMSEQPDELDAVRELCAMAGVSVSEPKHAREHSLCCGNYHGMRLIDGQRSALMRQRRLNEFPQGACIMSCCENCVNALNSGGALHLVELLFGKSEKRSFINRLKYTFK